MKSGAFNISPGAILIAILTAMTVSLFFLRVSLALSYLPEVGGVSINVLYGIIRMMAGSELYTSPELPPFPIIQYMPLHFHLVSFLGNVLGFSKDVHAMMVTNRLFCLVWDVATVLLIKHTLIKTFGMRKSVAWPLACIYFLSIPSIIYARVDNLYLFFFMATLAVLLKMLFQENQSPAINTRRILISGAFCALAILSKQTGIFLLALCSVYFLFFEKSVYRFALFCAGGILTILVGALFIHPESLLAFKLNVVDGVKNGINTNWFLEVLLKNFFLKFSYILAAGFFVGLLLLKERDKKDHLFLAFGIIWYFSTATLSAFKAGSGSNYYLEFIMLTIFGTALLLKKQNGPSSAVVLFALTLSPFFLIAAANDKGWGDIGMMKKAKKNYMSSSEVASYVLPKLKADEWVLTDFHKENTLNLQLSDKALFPCREVALYFTHPNGIFHFNAFKTLVTNGKVPYLIAKKGETIDEFLEVPLENYQADTLIGNYQVYCKKH